MSKGINKTDIEWADFTANPITGKCPHFGTPRCGTQARGYILGAESGRGAKLPSIESVKACLGHAGTKPIFIKDNLAKLFPDLPYHRELPWELHTK